MRLIDADELVTKLIKLHELKGGRNYMKVYGRLAEYVKTLPTVDPIKHGHWDNKQIVEDISPYDAPYTIARCSVCRGKVFVFAEDYLVNYPYCPLCGAKMDEVTDG